MTANRTEIRAMNMSMNKPATILTTRAEQSQNYRIDFSFVFPKA